MNYVLKYSSLVPVRVLYWTLSDHLSTYDFLTLKSFVASENDLERDAACKIGITN